MCALTEFTVTISYTKGLAHPLQFRLVARHLSEISAQLLAALNSARTENIPRYEWKTTINGNPSPLYRNGFPCGTIAISAPNYSPYHEYVR